MPFEPAERILFCSDPFRLKRGRVGGADSNVYLVEKLVTPHLRVVAPSWPRGKLLVGDPGMRLHPRDVYAAQGLPLADSSWAQLHDAAPEALSEDVKQRLQATLRGALLVAFELPPILQRWCTAQGIPWINLEVHPVRFLADLCWRVATNHPAVRARLAEFALTEAGFTRAAAGPVAHWRERATALPALAEGLIVLGQVSPDRSRIAAGRLWTLADCADAISAHARGRPVYFKPHPLGEPDVADEQWRARVKPTVLDANVYDLLAMRGGHEVCALSSSVLTEAAFFGGKAHRLMPAVVAVEPEISLGSVVFRRSFWARILAPIAPGGTRWWPRIPWSVRGAPGRALLQQNWGWFPEGAV